MNKTAFPMTSTAVMDDAVPESGFPLPFPLPVPTDAQVAAARACDVHTLYTARYQEVPLDSLPGVAPPESACDWATLAFAYGFRFVPTRGEPFPEAGDRAFFTTVDGNPALLYIGPLAEHYLLAGGVVEAPALAVEPLSALVITGRFKTAVGAARLDVTISGASTAAPTVSGEFFIAQVVSEGGTPTVKEETTPLTGPADAGAVTGLVKVLTDFVPLGMPLAPTGSCGGIEAQWTVEYRYSSGKVITVQGDTLWQTTIDEVQQYGPDMPVALNVLMEKMEIPIKAGAGTYCLDGELIDLAFPAGE